MLTVLTGDLFVYNTNLIHVEIAGSALFYVDQAFFVHFKMKSNLRELYISSSDGCVKEEYSKKYQTDYNGNAVNICNDIEAMKTFEDQVRSKETKFINNLDDGISYNNLLELSSAICILTLAMAVFYHVRPTFLHSTDINDYDDNEQESPV